MAAEDASLQPAGFTNAIKNVAIIGASGNIGSFITASLIATGKHTITALTRAGSNVTFPAGVHTKEIDYASHDSLVAALSGQDFLIISLSVMAPHDTQAKLIAAAKDAGVKWIMPNEYGTAADNEALGRDVKLGPPILAARKAIIDAGLNFVALSCGFWYEFSLSGSEARYGYDFAKREVTFYDRGETKITTSTWPQCGRAVAALLSLPVLPEREGDETLTLSSFKNQGCCVGSFFVSQKDMLDSVLRVTGAKEGDWTVRYEDSKDRFHRGEKMLAKGEMVGFGVLLYARVFFPDGSGDSQERLHNKLLALPEEDLDEATKVAVQMAEKAMAS